MSAKAQPKFWIEVRCRELARLNARGIDDLGVSKRMGCTREAVRLQRNKQGLPAVATDGVVKARKNASVTRLIRDNKSPGKRARVAATIRAKLDAVLLAPETIARVQAWRTDGVIWREIAVRLGVGERTLKARRERMGFLPKGRASPTPTAETKRCATPKARRISTWLLAPEVIEQVAGWRRDGMPWDLIAKRLGVSQMTLAVRRGQMGFEAPPRMRKPDHQVVKVVVAPLAKAPEPFETAASIAQAERILRDPPPVQPQRTRRPVEPLFDVEVRTVTPPTRPKLGQVSFPGSVLAGVLIHPAHRRA